VTFFASSLFDIDSLEWQNSLLLSQLESIVKNYTSFSSPEKIAARMIELKSVKISFDVKTPVLLTSQDLRKIQRLSLIEI